MRIAVIVDGLESTRQFHADDGQAMVDAAAMLTAIGKPVSVDVVHDEECAPILSTLPDSAYDAIVIASNALRHADGRAAAAVRQNSGAITEFLRRGRGLVLLHQYATADTNIALPEGPVLSFDRRPAGPARPVPADAESTLLNYPFPIDLATDLSTVGQLGELGSWLSVPNTLLQEFETVVRGVDGEALMAVSAEHFAWRVVHSALPLDWHGATRLLANCIEFACTGLPDVILWPSGAQSPMAATLGHLRRTHRVGADDPATRWLSRRPSLHLVSPVDRSTADSLVTATQRGGVVLAAGPVDRHGTVQFTGRVSARESILARDFFAADPATALRADTLDPFPTRNIVVAARQLLRSAPTIVTETWDPRRDAALHARLGALVYDGMTMTSALAVLQVLCAADADISLRRDVLARVALLAPGDPISDVLVNAGKVALGEAPMEVFVEEINRLGPGEATPPDALRILDWIGFLVLVLEVAGGPSLRPAVTRLLDLAEPASTGDLWLSHEGTATVALAVAAAGGDPAHLGRVARALARLRAEYHAATADGGHLSAAARYTQAIAAVERIAPLVLDSLAPVVSVAESRPDTDPGLAGEPRYATALAARNRELLGQLTDEQRKAQRRLPVFVAGATLLWVLATALAAAGVVAIVWSWHWPDIAQLTTIPAALAWAVLVGTIARGLDRLGILPTRLGRLADAMTTEARRRIRG
ncbi:hypothetical protein [Antribacter gilvus]|uniref:hypothetical protein n=1 Tax=Antribacter gilvus TaxID=2304675 RepID=UPI000F77C93A|nr:hypothetical protein [Antribacter gilvus]